MEKSTLLMISLSKVKIKGKIGTFSFETKRLNKI